MIFALAYSNLAMARDTANMIDKSDWDFEDLLGHFKEQTGDSKLLAAEMLLKHFSDQLDRETVKEMCLIEGMYANMGLISACLRVMTPEERQASALKMVKSLPVEKIGYEHFLGMLDSDQIRELAQKMQLKLRPKKSLYEVDLQLLQQFIDCESPNVSEAAMNLHRLVVAERLKGLKQN